MIKTKLFNLLACCLLAARAGGERGLFDFASGTFDGGRIEGKEEDSKNKGLFLDGGAKLICDRGQWYVKHAGLYAGGVWLRTIQLNLQFIF